MTRYRQKNANLRTQLNRIIKRAALKSWSKLFQNLRSMRETELAESFPIHVICLWIGNSVPVAERHYLQVTDEHFERAVTWDAGANPVQNQVQQPADSSGADSHAVETTESQTPAVAGTRDSK